MTRTVHVVLSEKPDHMGETDIDAQIVAIFSDPDRAERFAERYQRQVGRRLIVSVEEWAVDDTIHELRGDAA